MNYDMTTAAAFNQDSTRDDRWEVQAKGSDGHWWTVSDSSQMTETEAERLAADMRAAIWGFEYAIERGKFCQDATAEEVAELAIGEFQGAADLNINVEFARGEDADGNAVRVFRTRIRL